MNLLNREICGMAREYPNLFPRRRHLLNQLYCTVGSGHDWYKGRIQSEEIGPRGGQYFAENIYGYVEGSDPELEARLSFQGLQMPVYYSWYPLSTRYSPLLNIPRDPYHDWLDGAVETALLIYNTPYSNRYYYPSDHYRQQREYAYQIMIGYPSVVEDLYARERVLFPERSDTFFG